MAPRAPEVAAIVLCGGTNRRFGGLDKTEQSLGAATVLDHLLRELPTAWPVVCVGEPRPVELPRDITWAREDPPLGGPVAGIAAGLAALRTLWPAPTDASHDAIVVVLAGDQPFAGEVAPELVAALRADPGVDGVAARQDDGRPQLLLGAYRADRVAHVLSGEVTGHGVYRTFAPLRVAALPVRDRATLDVDAPADLDRARELHGRPTPTESDE